MAEDLLTWCDLHLKEAGVRVPGRLFTITVNGSTWDVDLCQTCEKMRLAPLVEFASTWGEVPTRRLPVGERTWRPKPGRRRGPFRCLAGCAATPLKNSDTLRQHLALVHDGLTLDEYVDRYGELVPLTPEEQAEVIEVRCEVEGCDRVYSTALGNRWPQQAMVSHLWGTHGIKWKPVGDATMGPVSWVRTKDSRLHP